MYEILVGHLTKENVIVQICCALRLTCSLLTTMTSTDLCFLKDFHFGVDVAENGQIALEKSRDKQYDLILMDLAMPVLAISCETNAN